MLLLGGMVKILSVLMILFVFSTPAMGGKLKVYTEKTGGAFFQNGQSGGSAVAVVNEIIKRVGSNEQIKFVPWMRGYDVLLHEADVALFPTTLTAEREPLFQWVGPILRLQWVLYARKGYGDEIRTLDDARKVEKVGVYLGDAKGKHLKELGFRNLDVAPDNFTNFRKLLHGRLDLVIGTNLKHLQKMESAGVDPHKVEPALVIKEMDLYIAFSMRTSSLVVDKWRKAFESMRKDGSFAEIYNKWYPDLVAPMAPSNFHVE